MGFMNTREDLENLNILYIFTQSLFYYEIFHYTWRLPENKVTSYIFYFL